MMNKTRKLRNTIALLLMLLTLSAAPSMAAKPTPVNAPPVITEGETLSITTVTSEALTFTLNATDKEKTEMTWDHTPPSSGSVILSDTANLRGKSSVKVTYTPPDFWTATSTFNVTVKDAAGATDSIAVTITLTGGGSNSAPVLTSIGSRSVNELEILAFTASASDPDNDPLIFSLTGAPYGALISSNGSFSWTPTEAQGPGTYTFNVVVSDGALTDSERITVVVNEVNLPPELNTIGNKSVETNKTLSFTAAATDADLPVNTLTFSLSSAPAGASISPNGDFSWTPSTAGTYSATVKVTDGTANDTEAFTITVTDPSTQPTEIRYVSLGDSIATGTTSPITNPTNPYVKLFKTYLDGKYTVPVFRTGFETDGDRTNELLDKLTTNTTLINAVSTANVITISIGGNNLMQAAKDPYALGGYNFNKFDASVAEQGRADFEAQFPLIMSRIRVLNPNADLMVITIYNPYNTSDTTLHNAVKSYLFRPNDPTYGINEMILEKASLFNYKVANVYQTFYDNYSNAMGTVTFFYPTDFWGRLTRNPHPNQTGQNIIFNLHKAIYEQLHP